MNLAEWLDATARAKPEAPAIFEGTRLYATYAGFAARVRALAAGLQKIHGVERGTRVAIFMKNCPAYLEVFYAVWWIGGTVVPINSKLHPREAAWIVGNSGASLLV
ncbi:MAG: AMP-binding protein, partial [Rhodobacteraceae bacterium]|nr:AMP-binding protein [Paracoccaceae bacterium]